MKELDKIEITTRTEKGPDADVYEPPTDTRIKINDKLIPYICSFNLEHSVDQIAGPVLNLELAIFEDMFNYDGYGLVNIDDLEIKDRGFAKQLYEKLKEEFEGDD